MSSTGKLKNLMLAGASLVAFGVYTSGVAVDSSEASAWTSLELAQDKPDEPKPEPKEPKKPEEKKPEGKKQEEDEDKEAEDNGDEKADDDENEKKDKKKKKKEKTIADVTKDYTVHDGLFKFYEDPKKGTLKMEIRADQLDKEFLYFSQVRDGVVEGGHFRGNYRQKKIYKLNKVRDKIELIQINPYFYFDPDNAISKAADANTSNAIAAVLKIEAKNEEKDVFLVRADNLFMSETFDPVKPTGRPGEKPGQRFKLGKLSKGRTKITDFRNYPENTSVNVDYVYTSPNPMNRGRAEITDPRSVTVGISHTLVAMPENDFKPRYEDPRVGYFLDYTNDMTNQGATPWRDVISRWHLVKKDPDADLSEPVEPIVWWMENTTPVELRPIIKKAGEAWNIAFEAAGFKNAVVVKQQPDDADWDAGDITKNVLRWTSSPTPPFGGYGPRFANPRTGQIIGADVMLEYTFLTNRLRTSNIFENAALSMHEEMDSDHQHLDAFKAHLEECSMGSYMQNNMLLGKTMAAIAEAGPVVDRKLIEQSVYYLVLHEIGHTLGLAHNMKATQARSYETAHDISAQDDGLIGSVMDYPAINIATPGESQSNYYITKPGTYDIWAIQYGYDPRMEDEAYREAHLARSTEKGLQFGNDADDMRAPGKGIDPRVNIYDFSDNAVAYAGDRMALARDALSKIKDKFTKSGESFQELRDAYLVVTGDIATQGHVASRYIGGVYVDRAMAGQDGATAPYRPVEKSMQKQAMQLLRDNIFGVDAFKIDPKLVQHLAIQRRGWLHGAGTEDPKLHARVTSIQSGILMQLLHPRTLMRLTDSAKYGNSYSVTEMMTDLTDAMFADDSRGTVNSYRQQLQVHYVHKLIDVMRGANYDYVARSNAFANLRNLRKDLARWRGDAATRAHREHLAYIIDKALEVNNG